MQLEQFPISVECLVGTLPEVRRLPQAPGLGMADGSDGDSMAAANWG